MKRIDTLMDLRQEKRRLLAKRMELEASIKQNYTDIKNSFEPVGLLTRGTEKVLGSNDNHLLGSSLGQVANMITKFTLKNSGFLPRLIVPFLVKNTTSKIVENHKTEILDWVGKLVSRFTGDKNKEKKINK